MKQQVDNVIGVDPRIRVEQLRMMCHTSKASPFASLVAAAVLVADTGQSVGYLYPSLWWCGLTTFLLIRRAYAIRLLQSDLSKPEPGLNALLKFGIFFGILVGIFPPLTFFYLNTEQQAVMLMVMVSWTAGGIAANVGYPMIFYSLIGPMLGPMFICFAVKGGPYGVTIAVLGALLAAFQISMLRENSRNVLNSVKIKFENQELLEKLTSERAAVIKAKELAEVANNAKSRFLAAASHDLRQPLHALSLNAGTLTLLEKTPQIGKVAEQISLGVHSLSELLDALLDVSKLDAGAVIPKHQRCDLQALVENLSNEFLLRVEQKGIELKVKTVPVWLETDPILTRQILSNVIDNAVKYTEVGHVSIEMSIERGRAVIKVSDTGLGIPTRLQSKIYEEFFQIGNQSRDRRKGLGLGLSIVRRLAQLIDAEVQLDSTEGKGSQFTLCLKGPCSLDSDGALTSGSVGPIPLQVRGEKVSLKILILDDESMVLESLANLLAAFGHHPMPFSSLDEAMKHLSSAKAPSMDCIIADYRLGQNQNGLDAIVHLQETYGPCTSFLITGDITVPDDSRFTKYKIKIFQKPVNSERLLAALDPKELSERGE